MVGGTEGRDRNRRRKEGDQRRKLQINKQMDTVFLKGCLKIRRPLIDITSLLKTAFLIY